MRPWGQQGSVRPGAGKSAKKPRLSVNRANNHDREAGDGDKRGQAKRNSRPDAGWRRDRLFSKGLLYFLYTEICLPTSKNFDFKNRFNVQSTGKHEFGHVLGFGEGYRKVGNDCYPIQPFLSDDVMACLKFEIFDYHLKILEERN